MKRYTVCWHNRPLVCLESQPGWLTPLPYETMNHLLMDAPDHRDQVLARAAKGRGEFSLGDVTVLAPIPHPRQDVICLGMNLSLIHISYWCLSVSVSKVISLCSSQKLLFLYFISPVNIEPSFMWCP